MYFTLYYYITTCNICYESATTLRKIHYSKKIPVPFEEKH